MLRRDLRAADQLSARPGNGSGEIGTVTTVPAPFATVLRGLTDPAGNPVFINDDINRREVSITPGRDYRNDVRDGGISAEAVYDFGAAELTSITAYRDYKVERGQDADFNNLRHPLSRRRDDRRFKTFTQEVRLQGTTFNDRLDWLVGGYYANERINVSDNLEVRDSVRQFRQHHRRPDAGARSIPAAWRLCATCPAHQCVACGQPQ